MLRRGSMCTELSGPVARRRGKLEHGVGVVRSGRMTSQAAGIAGVAPSERGESARVEARPQLVGQAFFDSALSELVPETHAYPVAFEDCSGDALVERRSAHARDLEQRIALATRTENRRGSDDRLGLVGQPCQTRKDSVPHSGKNIFSSAGQDLRHEKGVSRGRAVKRNWVDARSGRESLDRADG
jgi:hypothetical protein